MGRESQSHIPANNCSIWVTCDRYWSYTTRMRPTLHTSGHQATIDCTIVIYTCHPRILSRGAAHGFRGHLFTQSAVPVLVGNSGEPHWVVDSTVLVLVDNHTDRHHISSLIPAKKFVDTWYPEVHLPLKIRDQRLGDWPLDESSPGKRHYRHGWVD